MRSMLRGGGGAAGRRVHRSLGQWRQRFVRRRTRARRMVVARHVGDAGGSQLGGCDEVSVGRGREKEFEVVVGIRAVPDRTRW